MATYSITGTCVYCGQMATLNASEPMKGADADHYITEHCSCDCARHARRGDEARDSWINCSARTATSTDFSRRLSRCSC